MLKNLKNNKKKGFTLVELIVVLVILAILAALLIPALTGYIDKAKEKKIIAETRQLVMATQTIADEQYAKLDKGVKISSAEIGDTTGVSNNKLTISAADVKSLAEITVTKDTCTITMDTTENAKIATLVYTNGSQKCTYSATTKDYKVDEATP